jgi:hypothetical protein
MTTLAFAVFFVDREQVADGEAVFDESNFPGWAPLAKALFKLVYSTSCRWCVEIGDYAIEFGCDPDLVTVFDRIPDMLEHIDRRGRGYYGLYFFEQGTDLNMRVRAVGEDVEISFQRFDQAGRRRLPKGPVRVSADAFLRGWVRFAAEVLRRVVAVAPEFCAGDDYQQYCDRLDRIRTGG